MAGSWPATFMLSLVLRIRLCAQFVRSAETESILQCFCEILRLLLQFQFCYVKELEYSPNPTGVVERIAGVLVLQLLLGEFGNGVNATIFNEEVFSPSPSEKLIFLKKMNLLSNLVMLLLIPVSLNVITDVWWHGHCLEERHSKAHCGNWKPTPNKLGVNAKDLLLRIGRFLLSWSSVWEKSLDRLAIPWDPSTFSCSWAFDI